MLRKVYGFEAADMVTAIEALVGTENLVVDRNATDAGVAMLNHGGDFADCVIAHEGRWLGGDTFVSFDKKAVARAAATRYQRQLLT